ncbi:hypothetical protein CR513_32961, partial [Mucuna pruriens]
MEKVPHASTIGSFMYAQVCTRLDIFFIISALGRYLSKPDIGNWQVVKRVMRYLQGTSEYLYTYKRSDNLEVIAYCETTRQAVWLRNLFMSFILWTYAYLKTIKILNVQNILIPNICLLERKFKSYRLVLSISYNTHGVKSLKQGFTCEIFVDHSERHDNRLSDNCEWLEGRRKEEGGGGREREERVVEEMTIVATVGVEGDEGGRRRK